MLSTFVSKIWGLGHEEILSEARKYRLCLIAAHQYVDQLDDGLRKAVLGNVGTIIAFPVGPIDGRHLAEYFAPEFDINDLTGHDRFHMYLRLAIGGKLSKPFSAVVLPPLHGHKNQGSRARLQAAARVLSNSYQEA